MASTYVNNLRLEEQATGENSGAWGTKLNAALEQIGQALGIGSETIGNADATITVADGANDDARALYIKIASSTNLTATRTITMGPNTMKRIYIIENATGGAQSIIIKQGSGATVTVANSAVKIIQLDGAGSGAAVIDAFVDLDLTGTTTAAALNVSGNLDVDGTTNLDVVDIDGAVDMASTLVVDGNVGIGGTPNSYSNLNTLTINGTNGSVVDFEVNGTLSGEIFTESNSLKIDAVGSSGVLKLLTNSTERFKIASDGSLSTPTLGTSNVRFGVNAGNSIASGGNYNVAVGDEAGTAITTGDSNVFVGYQSGDATTISSSNTAVGESSLGTNILSSKNVAVGSATLFAHNLGSAGDGYNTAVGFYAGVAITTGVNNTLIGGLAGDAITTANDNVAVGFDSLSANTTGSPNTAVGKGSLNANTTGSNNTGLGRAALGNNTTASNNTAVGHFALLTNTTAANNTAVGKNALVATTTGAENTAVGSLAGDALTTGWSNTLLGYQAGTYLTNLTTGGTNTLIGAYNKTNAADSTFAIGLGYNLVCTSGYTTLGANTSDIRAAHGTATWAAVSDQRYKKDIVDSTAGLSFINALQPRTFKYKTLGELPETFSAYEEGSTEVFKNSDTNHGFIAQEVKAAIDADSGIKDGFRLWDDRDDGSQEVAEAALIPVLVKAIQELTARLETLEG